MPTAVSVYREIKKHAESIKNDETHRLGELAPGDGWAQGDLLIVSLAEVPTDYRPCAVERQLAPGTSQGSRHCLVSLDGVEMFRLEGGTPLDGPVFRSINGCEVDHPEHGNIVLRAGTYGVIYQRQYADELRRVAD